MKRDESPIAHQLHAAPADEPKSDEAPAPGDVADQSPDDRFEIPFPAPSDSAQRGFAVEIYGNERGGQKPKPPYRRNDDDL